MLWVSRAGAQGRVLSSSTTMSNVSFRDLTVVLIDTSRTVIQAGLGLHDLLRTPAVVRTVSLYSFTES